jgi:hypothetical protein
VSLLLPGGEKLGMSYPRISSTLLLDKPCRIRGQLSQVYAPKDFMFQISWL